MCADDTHTHRLLERFHAGDTAALYELLEQQLEWLDRYISPLLGRQLRIDGDTVDFRQEIIVKALRRGPRFVVNDVRHFRAILARMVRHQLCDFARNQRRNCRDIDRRRPLGTDSILYLNDAPVEKQSTPLSIAEKKEHRKVLRFCLELLPASCKRVIHSRNWISKTFEEISAEEGVTPEAVRRRYHRATALLAKLTKLVNEGNLEQALQASGRFGGAIHSTQREAL